MWIVFNESSKKIIVVNVFFSPLILICAKFKTKHIQYVRFLLINKFLFEMELMHSQK